MSNFRMQEPICSCGCCTVSVGACQQDTKGNWTTRAQRLADSSIVISSQQSYVFVYDYSWLICRDCKKDLDEAGLKVWAKEMGSPKTPDWMLEAVPARSEIEIFPADEEKPHSGIRFGEEIGIAVINPSEET